ncbi:MAG: hypothetical protein ACO3C1_02550 [Ilumatobacteraceae bacterium]
MNKPTRRDDSTLRLDRRVPLFAVLSAVCFLLSQVADDKYAHVPRVMGYVYAVLSLLFLVDWVSRARAASRSRK